MRLYDGGKDKSGKDANSTLNFLKWARGKSKIRPEEDVKPGLILIMRGFKLTPNKDGKTYTLLFLGEFNATRVVLSEETMRNLFAGKQVTWEIKGLTSKTTGVTRYNIETNVTVRVALEGDQLKLFSLDGTGSIETIGFSSKEKYISPTIQLGNPKGQVPIIVGSKAKQSSPNCRY